GKIFPYYQKLIQLRKEMPLISDGSYKGILLDDKEVYAYVREKDGQRLLVLNHFYGTDYTLTLPEEYVDEAAEVVIGNYETARLEKEMTLRPYETVAFLLK
ncbi:MAG: DUF3459 domain-containing protein, partial [Lactobacillales bacterium]|nr:DUF3459 domain-containing protein [Lactobacillales bacterium]